MISSVKHLTETDFRTYTFRELCEAYVHEQPIIVKLTGFSNKIALSASFICSDKQGVVGILPADVREVHSSLFPSSWLRKLVGTIVMVYISRIETVGDVTTIHLNRARVQQDTTQLLATTLGKVIPVRCIYGTKVGVVMDVGNSTPAICFTADLQIADPDAAKDRLALGVFLKCCVLGKESGILRVGHKQLLGTWAENVVGLSVGSFRVGNVISIISPASYMISLAPNLVGTLYSPDSLMIGQQVCAQVTHIDALTHTISLEPIQAANRMGYRYYTTGDSVSMDWQYD